MTLDYQLLLGVDKQLHFVSFAFISLFFGIVIILISDLQLAKGRITIIWMTLVSIGIIEEYRQYSVPDRSTEFLDAMANIIGVTGGLTIPVLLLFLIEHRRQFLSKVFGIYTLILIPFLLGLLFLNERPFFTLEGKFQESIKSLATFIEW